jgi:hypothetical protein
MKTIEKNMSIWLGQLFINGHFIHLLLHIYLSSFILSFELEKAIEVTWSTFHPGNILTTS